MFPCAETIAAPPHRVVLITPAEARQPDAPAAGEQQKELLSEDALQGPIILVHVPEEGRTYRSPIEINVEFQPRTAPIEIATLMVKYLKLIPIDITERVRPYASAAGIHLRNVDLPTGMHRVRITLADKTGQRSSVTVGIRVQ